MEGKSPTEIKGWVVKWQRALVTPFGGAAASGRRPIATGIDVIYRKKKYMTYERHIQMENETV